MRRHRTLFASLAVVGLLAGCGDDDESATTEPVTESVTEPSAVNSSGPDTSEPGSSEPPSDEPESSLEDDASADEGNDVEGCQVSVSGDTTAEWSAPDDNSAALVGYWLTDEEAEALGGGGVPLILNCQGSEGYVGFTARTGATETELPFGPNTYVLEPAEGALGTDEGTIGVLITLPGSATNWGVAEPGTLEITALDDEHISGTFAFSARDTLAELAGEASEGTVQITGSFTFTNKLTRLD